MSASFQSAYRTQHWQLTKPVAAGRDGIVVAQNREAAEAGVSVLKAGSNAADAAVATAFALSALEPWNSGLASVYQTLAFSLDFNMDAGAAAHAPRIGASGPEAVTANMRLPDDVLRAQAACAPLKVLEYGVLPINFTCPNLIVLLRLQ
jgi:gamma-glutamyltranspeptidase